MSFNLDPNSIEGGNDFSALPDGKYCAQVWDISEETRTSASGNEYSQARVQYRITDGPHENRRVFRNYIFDHPSEQAALIGQQGLKQLWTAQGASGSINVENLSVPTKIEIVLKTKESNGYGPRQEVVGVNVCKGGSCDAPAAPAEGGNPFA